MSREICELGTMDYIILKTEIWNEDEDITFYAFIPHEAWRKHGVIRSPPKCEYFICTNDIKYYNVYLAKCLSNIDIGMSPYVT
jgi:hypothetical protein